jgi:hypothetical protein
VAGGSNGVAFFDGTAWSSTFKCNGASYAAFTDTACAVATLDGVYVSFTKGAMWQLLGTRQPAYSIIRQNGKYLVGLENGLTVIDDAGNMTVIPNDNVTVTALATSGATTVAAGPTSTAVEGVLVNNSASASSWTRAGRNFIVNRLAWTGARFVGCNALTPTQSVYTGSPDGKTWTPTSPPWADTSTLTAVCGALLLPDL